MNQKVKQQTLQFLGLARRAGKLATGEATVLAKIRQQEVSVVLLAADVAPATKKKFSDKCRFYHVKLDDSFTRAELSAAIGSSRSVIAVTDTGFAKKLSQLLQL
jgi:ribosomal protein L7Ae-like RNA K-turn-binding protein